MRRKDRFLVVLLAFGGDRRSALPNDGIRLPNGATRDIASGQSPAAQASGVRSFAAKRHWAAIPAKRHWAATGHWPGRGGLATIRRGSEQSVPQFDLTIYTASTWVIPLLLAITLHEAAHGYVANVFGDDTALRMGACPSIPWSTSTRSARCCCRRSCYCFMRRFLRLRQAGAGQLPSPAQSSAGHDLGGGSRARHELGARYRGGAAGPRRRLSACRRRPVGYVESRQRHRHQRHSSGVQHRSRSLHWMEAG